MSGSSSTVAHQRSEEAQSWITPERSVLIVLVGILTLLAWRAPGFYQWQPILSLLTREAPTLVLAAGMAMILIIRQIDISVGSQVAVCGVVAGLLCTRGWPMAAVILVTLVLGTLMGVVNGIMVTSLRLPSIVVTLATMMCWREGLRWTRQGEFVNLPDGYQWWGLPQLVGQTLVLGMALSLVAVLALGLKRWSAGRFLYAVGSDSEAARLAGIPPRRVTFGVFAFMGMLCGVAALLNLVQSPQVDPKSGTGLELKAIAAAVVGGVAVSGGRGSLAGVFLGFLLLACINPALTSLQVEAYWEKGIQGVIILGAIVLESRRGRKL